MKSRGMVITLVILGIVVLLVMWGSGLYNSLVSLDEGVTSAWSQVENQYQRRADLIPNLVATVKGFAAQEREVLQAVTEARARVGQLTVTKEVLDDPEAFAKFQQAQDAFSSAISRLLVVTENYPELRSNQNFLALQDQLEGTENRIAVARKSFNETVQSYNTSVRRLPGSLVAMVAGFRERQYFKAQEGAEQVPQVQF